MERRRYLVCVTGVTAALAGCEDVSDSFGEETEGGDDEESAQVQTVREFYQALSEEDIVTVSELYHSEAPAFDGEISEEDLPISENTTVTVDDAELVTEGDEESKVEAQLTFSSEESQEEETRTVTVTLRTEDEEWRIWQIRQGPAETPAGTPEDGTPDDDTPTEGEDTGQTQIVREFYDALSKQDVATLNELYHSDAPELAGEITEADVAFYEDATVTVESTAVVSDGVEESEVEAELSFSTEDSGQPRVQSVIVELRREGGAWRIWRIRQSADETPEETPDDEEETPDDDTPTDGEDTGQTQIVRAFYDALSKQDGATVNELYHSEAPNRTGEITEDDLAFYEDVTVTVESATVVSEGGNESEVRAELSLSRDRIEQEQSDTVIVELRREGGAWRIWRIRQSADEEDTSEDNDDDEQTQVANRVEVVSTAGTGLDDEAVGRVSLVVQKAPGAADIDVSEATIQWVGPNGAFTLTHGSQASQNTFALNEIADDDSSLPVLNDSGDRFEIVLDTDAFGSGGLAEGESAQLTITTAAGGETQETLNVPQTLSGEQAVRL